MPSNEFDRVQPFECLFCVYIQQISWNHRDFFIKVMILVSKKLWMQVIQFPHGKNSIGAFVPQHRLKL